MKLFNRFLYTGIEMVLIIAFMVAELGILYICVGCNNDLFAKHYGSMIGSIAAGTVYMEFMYLSPYAMVLYKKFPFWFIMLIFNPINLLIGWLNYLLDSVFIQFLFNEADWGLAVGLRQQFVFIVAGSYYSWFEGVQQDVSGTAKFIFCYTLSWILWVIFAYQVVGFNSTTDLTLSNNYFIMSGFMMSFIFVVYCKATTFKVYKFQFRNIFEQVTFVSFFTIMLSIVQYLFALGLSIAFYPGISKLLRVQNTQQLVSLGWVGNNIIGRHLGEVIWETLGKIKNTHLRLIPYIFITWIFGILLALAYGAIFHYFIYEILIVKGFGQPLVERYAQPDQVLGIACGNFIYLYDGIEENCGGFWKIHKHNILKESVDGDIRITQDGEDFQKKLSI